MKLFRYQNFIKESKKRIHMPTGWPHPIHSICKKYNIQNYTINEDGSIDVNGSVYLSKKGLTELPLKFGKVSGNFSCSYNQLTSLEGSPSSVGTFYCSYNQLTSLEGSPREVQDFYCDDNQLTSLSGISQEIRRNISCKFNKIRDVKGIKDGWDGLFHVYGNPVFKIFELFPEDRFCEVIEYLNEHEVIRDGKLVILQRLDQVFHDMELEVPDIEHIKGYDIQF
jgi:hypothetical protein